MVMGLGAQMESLAEQILGSRAARSQMAAERAGEVSALLTATQQQVEGFRVHRADVAAAMHTELAQAVEQRRDEVRRQLAEADQQLKAAGDARRAAAVPILAARRAEVAERAAEVRGTLQHWDAERRQAGTELMHALQAERAVTTAALHQQLDEFRAGLAGAVRTQLAESRGEREWAARAWASLSAGAGAAVDTEQLPGAAGPSDQPQARGDVQASILAYVNAHPEGVRLTDIAAALVLPRVHAGRLTRHLVDDGQLRKDDLLYLPAASGNSAG